MEVLNQYLDRYALLKIRLLNRSWPAFQFWILVGSVLAIASTMLTVIRLGLSTVVMALIIAAALVTSLTLAMTIKILTGEERHVFFHTAITVMAVTTLLLWFLGQPILPYLDVTVLGIGVLLASGRIGCFMVGCCHGRPSAWGVRYGQEYADEGFASYFTGVRLFPIQLVESLLVVLIIAMGSIVVPDQQAPGALLAFYVISYCVGRFFIELLRGDPQRPYALGFSDAQWTSLALIGLVVYAESRGVLPLHIWHLIAAAGLSLAMIAVALRRSLQDKTTSQFLHPRNVHELATVIEFATNHASELLPPFSPPRRGVPQEIYIACTGLGIQVSASKIKYSSVINYHYALSHRDRSLTEKTAKPIANLILKLRRATEPGQFLSGKDGIFHLLFCSSEAAD